MFDPNGQTVIAELQNRERENVSQLTPRAALARSNEEKGGAARQKRKKSGDSAAP